MVVRFRIASSLVALFGCSEPSEDRADPTGAEAGASGLVSCAQDPRVDRYVAHLEKSGMLGNLAFEIVESDPAPPSKGNNRFVVRVKDSAGTPFASEIGVTSKMPDHGHDTSVTPAVSFDAESRATTLDPVYFFMAGVWSVELHAQPIGGGSPLDRVEFFFCIEG